MNRRTERRRKSREREGVWEKQEADGEKTRVCHWRAS